MIETQRFDPCASGVFESRRIGTIGDYNGDRRVEMPTPDGIDKRLQIAPAPGNENAESAIHGRLT